MTNPPSDSYRNPLRHMGQDYSFAPRYYRPRDPNSPTNASNDIKPKEQQGYYPLGSLWSTSTNGNLWALAGITNNLANWVLLSGSSGPLIKIGVPAGTSPINPDANGLVSFTSTGGTITITGSAGGLGAQNINFDLSGGTGAVDSIAVQAVTAPGVTPVTPTALGLLTLNGATVAAHSVPLETRSRALNTINIEAQVASAVAATPANTNNVGLSCFRNTQFSVDATSGMVSMVGSANPAVQGINVDANTPPGTDPVLADGSGNVTIQGGATFATNTQANPIRTNSLAANTLDLQIQLAGSNASSSSANKYGVAQFDSNYYTVTSGYVTDSLANYTFSAYLNANSGNETGDGTETRIQFNTELYDPNSNFDTSTFQYTVPVTGEYIFDFAVRLETTTGNFTTYNRAVAFIYARDTPGGSVTQAYEYGNLDGGVACALPDAPNNDALSINGTAIMRLTAGNSVECRCLVTGGAKSVLEGGLAGATKITFFQGRCISRY